MEPNIQSTEFFVLTNETEDRFMEDGVMGWTTDDVEDAYRFKTAEDARSAAVHLPIGLDRVLKVRETITIEKVCDP